MTFPALTVALNGVLQAVSAILTFTFLPKIHDPGYFSDKSILSRLFVKENLFYQLMVLFGAVYYSDWGYEWLRTSGGLLGNTIEALWVFLPYVAVRPFFPTTRLGTAIGNTKTKSEGNIKFCEFPLKPAVYFSLCCAHLSPSSS